MFVLRRIDTSEYEQNGAYWANDLRKAFQWKHLKDAKEQQTNYRMVHIETEIIDLSKFEVLF